MIITDHINKLEAVVTYNPPSNEKSKGMLKRLFKKKSDGETQLSDCL